MVITPHEAMIYFMLGNAYQKIGDHPQSMIYFSWAMELDPKGVNSSLRDIMASGPSGLGGPGGPRLGGAGAGSSRPPPLAPFVCSAAVTLADQSSDSVPYGAPESSSPAPQATSTSTRTSTGRRGGSASVPRSRRSARGRLTTTSTTVVSAGSTSTTGRSAGANRFFLSGKYNSYLLLYK